MQTSSPLASVFPESVCEAATNLSNDYLIALPQRRRQMQNVFRKFWSDKIMNDQMTELRELDDLDPIIRMLDVGGQRYYDYEDQNSRDNLSTRLVNSGKQYGAEYAIEDHPNSRRLKVANIEGITSTMISQAKWYAIFQDIKTDASLKQALDELFQTSDETRRIELIDRIRSVNGAHKNPLTAQAANGINGLLACYNPDDYLSILSLNHRKMIITKLGLGVYPDTESYGTRVIKSNSIILSINDKCPTLKAKLHPSSLSRLLYNRDVKPIWLPELESASTPSGTLEKIGQTRVPPDETLHPQFYLLDSERQVIFYGPPGTGKTYSAEQLADSFLRRKNGVREIQTFRKLVQFHPSYSYEDFVEGLAPKIGGDHGSAAYEFREGALKELCRRATGEPNKSFVLIIDEINRGNIPKIFGELLYGIENRGKSITLAYSQSQFQVPQNLFIIGTMNTADKSIALIDVALRRRFASKEMMPDPDLITEPDDFPFSLKVLLTTLNDYIAKKLDRERQIGHTYLMGINNLSDFRIRWFNRIIPLLQEYFFGDFRTLADVIGGQFVEADNERINDDLGDDELVQAVEKLIQSKKD